MISFRLIGNNIDNIDRNRYFSLSLSNNLIFRENFCKLFWHFYSIRLMFKIEENGDKCCLKKEWEIGIDSKSAPLEVTSSLSHPSPFQVVGLIPECQTFEIPYEAMPREMLSLNISKSIYHRFSVQWLLNDILSFLPHRKKNLIRMKSSREIVFSNS